MLKSLIIVASLAASSAALAAPAHLTDSQYLSAVRCRALIASPALGKGDTSAIDSMLKTEAQGRNPALFDRMDEVRDAAARDAGHAGPDQKARLIAERNNVCSAYDSGQTITAAAQMGQAAGAN